MFKMLAFIVRFLLYSILVKYISSNSINIHLLVYLMMLATPCLARYRFDPRSPVEEDEGLGEGEWVDCPVCETPSDSPLLNHEVCEKRNGKSEKLCLFGTYINDVCGFRRDCYRGPAEPCTTKLINDIFNQQCAPGYVCSRATGMCTGLGNHYKTGQLHLINPGVRYSLAFSI